MESEKRKRVSDGEKAGSGRRGKAREGGGGAAVKGEVPADEEVEEFFAILRRIQVAVKYFQERDGGREMAAPPQWNPSFEREDFDGLKKPEGNRYPALDLNSDPAISDESRVVSDSV
ncbi:hypothetical protein PHJA_001803900 [Phtheirospermum japonicum]|uniref:Uncharacterized protein n=1 Tax=Phtheirospermum japonicum TaxID=374723 RepID=A0A830CHK0_9LAMI|nr:hypothetical protein PHJA_001803900 [Phtheirospermum japonicum]